MVYPPFVSKHATIGIPAPSNGVHLEGKLMAEFAKAKLEHMGHTLMVSPNRFHTEGIVSANSQERAQEFLTLWQHPKTELLLALTGGEFEVELLPFLPLEQLAKTPKWFQGFSDNTALCFTLTVTQNVATLYHYNLRNFGYKQWHKSHQQSVQFWQGLQTTFTSFSHYEPPNENPPLCVPNKMHCTQTTKHTQENASENFSLTGRMLGGCLDILVCLCGTPYDQVKQFNKRYESDGVLWYFETCELNPAETKRALWQLKNAGWFENANGFLFGMPLNNDAYKGLTFQEACLDVLSPLLKPILFGCNIGHIKPTVPVVNGSLATVTKQANKLTYHYELKP